MTNKIRKETLTICSSGDWSVGIPSFCEKGEIEITSTKIKYFPKENKKKTIIEPFEEEITKNLMTVSDTILENELKPYFEEYDIDRIFTEKNYQIFHKHEEDENNRMFMEYLDELGSSEREKYFRKEYKPIERDKIKKEFQMYKKSKK